MSIQKGFFPDAMTENISIENEQLLKKCFIICDFINQMINALRIKRTFVSNEMSTKDI